MPPRRGVSDETTASPNMRQVDFIREPHHEPS